MFDFFLAKCFVGTTKLINQEWCFLQNLIQKGRKVEWHQLKKVVKGSNTIKLFEEFLIESVLPFCRLLEANSMLFVSPSALIGRHCAWFQSFISLLSWSAWCFWQTPADLTSDPHRTMAVVGALKLLHPGACFRCCLGAVLILGKFQLSHLPLHKKKKLFLRCSRNCLRINVLILFIDFGFFCNT